jgi:hypothetical protein
MRNSLKPSLGSAVEKTDDLVTWKAKLDAIGSLPPGWDSYSAPSPTESAMKNARCFLAVLVQSNRFPSRLAPSVVGGVGFTFKRNDLKVYVEFSNRGTAHALFSDGVTDPRVEKVEPTDAGYRALMAEIRTYLNA